MAASSHGGRAPPGKPPSKYGKVAAEEESSEGETEYETASETETESETSSEGSTEYETDSESEEEPSRSVSAPAASKAQRAAQNDPSARSTTAGRLPERDHSAGKPANSPRTARVSDAETDNDEGPRKAEPKRTPPRPTPGQKDGGPSSRKSPPRRLPSYDASEVSAESSSSEEEPKAAAKSAPFGRTDPAVRPEDTRTRRPIPGRGPPPRGGATSSASRDAGNDGRARATKGPTRTARFTEELPDDQHAQAGKRRAKAQVRERSGNAKFSSRSRANDGDHESDNDESDNGSDVSDERKRKDNAEGDGRDPSWPERDEDDSADSADSRSERAPAKPSSRSSARAGPSRPAQPSRSPSPMSGAGLRGRARDRGRPDSPSPSTAPDLDSAERGTASRRRQDQSRIGGSSSRDASHISSDPDGCCACGVFSSCQGCWSGLVRWRIWSWLRRRSAYIVALVASVGMLSAGGTGVVGVWTFCSVEGYDLGGLGYCQGGACTVQPFYTLDMATPSYLPTIVLSALLLGLSLLGTLILLFLLYLLFSVHCSSGSFTPPHRTLLYCFFNPERRPSGAEMARLERRAQYQNGMSEDRWEALPSRERAIMVDQARMKRAFEMTMWWGGMVLAGGLLGGTMFWKEGVDADEGSAYEILVWGGMAVLILWIISSQLYRSNRRGDRAALDKRWAQADERLHKRATEDKWDDDDDDSDDESDDSDDSSRERRTTRRRPGKGGRRRGR